jgi:hypothetical protein
MNQRDAMRISLILSLLLLATPTAYPQRCGDSLLLFLRDREGRVIAPADFESARVSATYTMANLRNLVYQEPDIRARPRRVKSFAVRVECGMKLAQFRLKYQGEEMTIRVLNIPGDAGHILMEGIRFRQGIFAVDLGNRPLKNVEANAGEESKAEDPADEIRWVIRDRSLKKMD